jgi:IS5 family transposase
MISTSFQHFTPDFLGVLPMSDAADFFRSRLEQMIDLRHPLAVLASRLPWQELEANVAAILARRVRAGKKIEGEDLFGPLNQSVVSAPSAAGRPRVSLRVLISLLYLKHAFNESDEAVVERWGETPTWQYFSGSAYFEHRQPCDSTTLIKFRKAIGEEGVEELLAQTVNTALQLKLISPKHLETIIVDTTVQPKAIAHPTDSRLLEVARGKLVELAKEHQIPLKQTFAKEGKSLRFQAGRYAHARQFKRMRRVVRRQNTIVRKLGAAIESKMTALSEAVKESLGTPLAKAKQFVAQARTRKVKGRNSAQSESTPKIYSWHAPEPACINKVKARTPYEFGAKVSIATSLHGNLVVGARAFGGNPFDGHTLAEQIEQTTILLQDNGIKPTTEYVDLGYRGVDQQNPGIQINHRGKSKRLNEKELKLLKRRQSIEPTIGHLKQDHRMGRCHLRGETGDRIHAVLCAAGYNIRWLLRMILKKGIGPFLCLIFSLVVSLISAVGSCRSRMVNASGGGFRPVAA